MKESETVEITVRALLSTLPPTARARIVSECTIPAAVENRIIRRADAAKMLGRSTRAVSYLVSSGVLPKVTFPGHARGAGFRLSDIQSLIGGG